MVYADAYAVGTIGLSSGLIQCSLTIALGHVNRLYNNKLFNKLQYSYW